MKAKLLEQACSRVTVVRTAAGLLALSLLLMPASAPAEEALVVLGAIGVGTARPALRGELRALLREELSQASFSGLKTSEHYVLSAHLVRLDSVQSLDSARATCVVSVALVTRAGSLLYAQILGRATAEASKARESAVQSDALRAAVHSAMLRVPHALR